MAILKQYQFDFCTVQQRDDNILLFEFKDGIEVDADMAAELTRAADENMTGPFGILSNRINSYSLSFEAMAALAQYDNMVALAIVVHDAKSYALVEAQNYLISALKSKPIKIFMDTDAAISWLHATLPKSPTTNQATSKQQPNNNK